MTDKCTLANSFPYREVQALLELHALIMRGGDARQVAKSPEILSLVRKFQSMRTKHRLYHGAAIGTGDEAITDGAA
jgi:hypothetical protein